MDTIKTWGSGLVRSTVDIYPLAIASSRTPYSAATVESIIPKMEEEITSHKGDLLEIEPIMIIIVNVPGNSTAVDRTPVPPKLTNSLGGQGA